MEKRSKELIKSDIYRNSIRVESNIAIGEKKIIGFFGASIIEYSQKND